MVGKCSSVNPPVLKAASVARCEGKRNGGMIGTLTITLVRRAITVRPRRISSAEGRKV